MHDSQRSHTIPLRMTLSDGYLELQDFLWQCSGGRLCLSARLPIHANGEIAGTARLESIDLGSAGQLLVPGLRHFSGAAQGELSFRAPMEHYADRQAWQWSGPVRLRNLRVWDLEFDSLEGTLTFQKGVLSLRDSTALLFGRTLSGDLALQLNEPFDLAAAFRMTPVELAELEPARIAHANDGLRGSLEASGKLSGRLSHGTIQLTGHGIVRRLGFGSIAFPDVPFQYELVENGFRFFGMNLAAYGGRFRGSGRWLWPRERLASSAQAQEASRWNSTGASELRLLGTFENIESSQILQSVSLSGVDVRGLAAGELQIRLDLSDSDPSSAVRITGRASSKRLHIAGVPVADASADFEYDGRALTAHSLGGELTAGAITGNAQIDLTQQRRWVEFKLKSDRLELAALEASLSRRSSLGRLAGTVAGQLFLQVDLESGDLTGEGSGRIQSLAMSRLPVIDGVLVPHYELRAGKILAPAFQAELWGGTATGSCEIDLTEHAPALAELSLTRVERVELARIMSLWPAVAGAPRGKVSGTGKITVPAQSAQQAVVGAGEFTIESGAFAGLSLGRTAGTLEAFDASTHEIVAGRVQARRGTNGPQADGQRVFLRIREAQPARGSLQASVLISESTVMTYDASLRFNGLDLATVAHALFANRHPVSGTLSGEMRLIGTERGTEDAQGEMWLRVDNGNLWRFPVLAVFVRESTRVFNRLLNLNLAEQNPQTALARRVTLDNGVLHVHEFWIAGDMGRLFGEGEIALDGSIDLDFVGNFDTGLPKSVPLLSQLSGALNFLQQRLVKIHLTGTLTDPVAIPVPLQDLTEPAERFFRGVITGTLFDEPSRSAKPIGR